MNNLEALHSYIQKVATKTMGTSVQDLVVTGVITHIAPGSGGAIYEFETEGAVAPQIASSPGGATYSVGDEVFLIAAESGSGLERTKSYQIFGLVKLVENAYKIASEYERFVVEISDNIITDKVDVSAPTIEGETSEITVLENFSKEKPELVQTIALTGYIDLKATFALSEDLSRMADYGLKLFTLAENGSILEEFLLNPPYFIGQPYKTGENEQHRFIKLNRDKFSLVKDLKLEAYNKTDKKITISNIIIASGNLEELKDKFSLEITPDKSYLGKEEEQTIKITAKGFFENQELSADVLKYFWFIKDDSIGANAEMKENEAGINPLMGAGWKCLTTFKYATKVVGSDIVQDTSVKLWSSNNNFFDFDASLFTKFENIVKCVAVYQGCSIESEELIIYNYGHELYSGSLSADKTNLTLIFPEDNIVLTCNIVDENIVTKKTNSSYTYQWYADGQELEGKTSQKLEVKEVLDIGYREVPEENLADGFSNSVDYYVYNEENSDYEKADVSGAPAAGTKYYIKQFRFGSCEFSCVVKVGQEIIYDSNENDNNITILSQTQEYRDGELITETQYGYWICKDESDNRANRKKFKKIIVNDDKDEATDTVLNSYTNWELITETESDEKEKTSGDPTSNDIFNEEANGDYFVYSTSQNIIKKQETKRVLTKQDWTKPIISRYIRKTDDEIRDLYSESVLNQLNTFNLMTNGGKKEGIFYNGATYKKSEVFDPKKLITGQGYYEMKEEEVYAAISLLSFQPGTDYYKKDGSSYVKIASTDSFDSTEQYYILERKEVNYILLEQNADNYIMTGDKPSGFVADKEYYEQVGNELYINASYINTGALTVEDNDGDIIFQAGWDVDENGGPLVQIAGFNVTSDKIKSEVGDVIVSPTEFKIGEGIYSAKDENGKWSTSFKGSLSIVGKNSDDSAVDFWAVIDNIETTPGASLETQYQAASSKDDLEAANWTSDVPTDVAENERIYIRQKLSNETKWSEPFPISALDGEIGADGASTKFVYYRSANEVDWKSNSAPDLPSYDQNNGFVIERTDWKESPQGITETEKYEYMYGILKPAGTETIPHPNWDESSIFGPVLWSKWGDKGDPGEDGSPLTYRYIKTIPTVIKAEKSGGNTVFNPNKIEIEIYEIIGDSPATKIGDISDYSYTIGNSISTSAKQKIVNDQIDLPGQYYDTQNVLVLTVFDSYNNQIDKETIEIEPGIEEVIYQYQAAEESILSANNLIGNWYPLGEFFSTPTNKKEWPLGPGVTKLPEPKGDNGTWLGRNDEKPTGTLTISSHPRVWKSRQIKYIDGTYGPIEATRLDEAEAAKLSADIFFGVNENLNNSAFVSFVGLWCFLFDRTIIDGGSIMTGSVQANSIAANAITAEKIATDALKSRGVSYEEGTEETFSNQGSFFDLNEGNIFTPSFYVKNDEAGFKGNVIATGGTIGGFHITDTHLASGENKSTDPHLVMISGADNGYGSETIEGTSYNYAFWAGQKSNNTNYSRPFWVTTEGKLKATDADITGNINADSGYFHGKIEISATENNAFEEKDIIIIDPDSSGMKIKGNLSDKSSMFHNSGIRLNKGTFFSHNIKISNVEKTADNGNKTTLIQNGLVLLVHSFDMTVQPTGVLLTQGVVQEDGNASPIGSWQIGSQQHLDYSYNYPGYRLHDIPGIYSEKFQYELTNDYYILIGADKYIIGKISNIQNPETSAVAVGSGGHGFAKIYSGYANRTNKNDLFVNGLAMGNIDITLGYPSGWSLNSVTVKNTTDETYITLSAPVFWVRITADVNNNRNCPALYVTIFGI